MRILQHILSHISATPKTKGSNLKNVLSFRVFFTSSGGGGGEVDWGSKHDGTSTSAVDLGWDVASSWSTGLTKEHFDGEVVGQQIAAPGTSSQFAGTIWTSEEMEKLKELEEENHRGQAYVDG